MDKQEREISERERERERDKKTIQNTLIYENEKGTQKMIERRENKDENLREERDRYI